MLRKKLKNYFSERLFIYFAEAPGEVYTARPDKMPLAEYREKVDQIPYDEAEFRKGLLDFMLSEQKNSITLVKWEMTGKFSDYDRAELNNKLDSYAKQHGGSLKSLFAKGKAVLKNGSKDYRIGGSGNENLYRTPQAYQADIRGVASQVLEWLEYGRPAARRKFNVAYDKWSESESKRMDQEFEAQRRAAEAEAEKARVAEAEAVAPVVEDDNERIGKARKKAIADRVKELTGQDVGELGPDFKFELGGVTFTPESDGKFPNGLIITDPGWGSVGPNHLFWVTGRYDDQTISFGFKVGDPTDLVEFNKVMMQSEDFDVTDKGGLEKWIEGKKVNIRKEGVRKKFNTVFGKNVADMNEASFDIDGITFTPQGGNGAINEPKIWLSDGASYRFYGSEYKGVKLEFAISVAPSNLFHVSNGPNFSPLGPDTLEECQAWVKREKARIDGEEAAKKAADAVEPRAEVDGADEIRVVEEAEKEADALQAEVEKRKSGILARVREFADSDKVELNAEATITLAGSDFKLLRGTGWGEVGPDLLKGQGYWFSTNYEGINFGFGFDAAAPHVLRTDENLSDGDNNPSVFKNNDKVGLELWIQTVKNKIEAAKKAKEPAPAESEPVVEAKAPEQTDPSIVAFDRRSQARSEQIVLEQVPEVKAVTEFEPQIERIGRISNGMAGIFTAENGLSDFRYGFITETNDQIVIAGYRKAYEIESEVEYKGNVIAKLKFGYAVPDAVDSPVVFSAVDENGVVLGSGQLDGADVWEGVKKWALEKKKSLEPVQEPVVEPVKEPVVEPAAEPGDSGKPPTIAVQPAPPEVKEDVPPTVDMGTGDLPEPPDAPPLDQDGRPAESTLEGQIEDLQREVAATGELADKALQQADEAQQMLDDMFGAEAKVDDIAEEDFKGPMKDLRTKFKPILFNGAGPGYTFERVPGKADAHLKLEEGKYRDTINIQLDETPGRAFVLNIDVYKNKDGNVVYEFKDGDTYITQSLAGDSTGLDTAVETVFDALGQHAKKMDEAEVANARARKFEEVKGKYHPLVIPILEQEGLSVRFATVLTDQYSARYSIQYKLSDEKVWGEIFFNVSVNDQNKTVIDVKGPSGTIGGAFADDPAEMAKLMERVTAFAKAEKVRMAGEASKPVEAVEPATDVIAVRNAYVDAQEAAVVAYNEVLTKVGGRKDSGAAMDRFRKMLVNIDATGVGGGVIKVGERNDGAGNIISFIDLPNFKTDVKEWPVEKLRAATESARKLEKAIREGSVEMFKELDDIEKLAAGLDKLTPQKPEGQIFERREVSRAVNRMIMQYVLAEADKDLNAFNTSVSNDSVFLHLDSGRYLRLTVHRKPVAGGVNIYFSFGENPNSPDFLIQPNEIVEKRGEETIKLNFADRHMKSRYAKAVEGLFETKMGAIIVKVEKGEMDAESVLWKPQAK